MEIRDIKPFLVHDVQNLFLAENGIFLLDEVDDAVSADIEGVGIKLPHNLPAWLLRFEGRTLVSILRVALHDLPARPIRSQRHLIPSSDSSEYTGSLLCFGSVTFFVICPEN
jgi:hypothetical protein